MLSNLFGFMYTCSSVNKNGEASCIWIPSFFDCSNEETSW